VAITSYQQFSAITTSFTYEFMMMLLVVVV
jgi:hypothetical protein